MASRSPKAPPITPCACSAAGCRRSRPIRPTSRRGSTARSAAGWRMVAARPAAGRGGSHGIGHVLGGTAGVPHGYTSCVILPHVLRFNHSVNGEKQARVSEALGRPEIPAAEVVAELISALGLPTRLRDVG